LVPQIERVWDANMQVYGADKVWKQLAPRGDRGGPLHGGASDAALGTAWRDARQGREDDHQRQQGALPLGS